MCAFEERQLVGNVGESVFSTIRLSSGMFVRLFMPSAPDGGACAGVVCGVMAAPGLELRAACRQRLGWSGVRRAGSVWVGVTGGVSLADGMLYGTRCARSRSRLGWPAETLQHGRQRIAHDRGGACGAFARLHHDVRPCAVEGQPALGERLDAIARGDGASFLG